MSGHGTGFVQRSMSNEKGSCALVHWCTGALVHENLTPELAQGFRLRMKLRRDKTVWQARRKGCQIEQEYEFNPIILVFLRALRLCVRLIFSVLAQKPNSSRPLVPPRGDSLKTQRTPRKAKILV